MSTSHPFCIPFLKHSQRFTVAEVSEALEIHSHTPVNGASSNTALPACSVGGECAEAITRDANSLYKSQFIR